MVKMPGTGGEPEAGKTINAPDGAGSHLSKAALKPFQSVSQEVSISSEKSGY
jgi:hypothetical protein